MKRKIVLWGSNEKEEKLLIAIELLEKDNKIRIHTFDAEKTTEEFYNQMMNLWRNDGNVIFPEHHQSVDRDLSLSESLLPDNIKVERSDLIIRAKTEWHFVVLSSKLYEAYRDEINEFQERIEEISSFDSTIWEEMKSFWNKVQNQVREKTLFKEHADDLRNSTNDLFSRMKEHKRSMEEEFSQFSKQRVDQFFSKLDEIDSKIEEGLGLQPLFNQLKDLQKKFRDTEFTRSDRSKVWRKLDGAFKKIKEKKFGSRSSDKSTLDRVQRRYNGLMAAIDKMKNSINRDQNEMEFQTKKIESTDGQLEMQIRQAKLSMIKERISSKEEKLKEMLKTKEELERKLKIEKEKLERKKEAEKKAKPADQQNGTGQDESGTSSKKDEETKTKESSDEKGEKKKSKDSMMGAIATTVGESLGDVIDTVKAVADVVEDKIEEKIKERKKGKSEEE